MSHIQIRIDKKEKEEARRVLEELGLDMSSAIKLFLKQVVIQKGLPFDVFLNSKNDSKKHPGIQKIPKGRRLA